MRLILCISVPKIWLSTACCLLSLFFVPVASAVDYYWHLTSAPGGDYSSAFSGCSAYLSYMQSTAGPTVTYSSGSSSFVDADTYMCRLNKAIGASSYPNASISSVQRYGNSCPPDTTYNSATGACDAPPEPEPELCEPTVGQTISHQHRMGDFTGSGDVGGYTAPPGVLCANQCQYAFSGNGATNVFRFADNNPNGVFGVYTYVGNGVQCQGGESALTTPAPPTPSAEKSSSCTNKVTDAEGRVTYTCTSSEFSKNPGSSNCGEVDGKVKCYSKTPISKLTDKQVTTDVSEKTNADGSKDTTTTTTTNKTQCSGVGSCSTTTTTNTTNSRTNADGSAGDESSTCTGEGCSSSGSGSGSGSGQEGQEGQEDEEETEQSAVSGDTACLALPACEGDAIQCAILRQTHQSRCEDEEFRDLDDTELMTSLNTEFAGSEFQALTSTAEHTHTLTGMLDVSGTFSSACPAFPTVSYNWVDGSSRSIDLNQPGFCDYLRWMGYLLVAFAMRGAAEIIARGLV